MKIAEKTNSIQIMVRNHGSYRELSKKTGVGYEWLTKFATLKIKNPTVSNIAKLEEYFDSVVLD